MRRFAWLLVTLCFYAPLLFAQRKPAYPDGLYAEVTTNKGLIVAQLEFEKTPLTVSNFVGLAEGLIANTAIPLGKPYFNGTSFHRVVPGHVIQCGIPVGATPDPGYQFPNEIVLPDLNHGRAGMLTMANGGAHTNGSQWCITLGDRSYLDGDYTVFGQVVRGMNVVSAIVRGDEIQKIRILRVGKKAGDFRPSNEEFVRMADSVREAAAVAASRRKTEDEGFIQTTWPEATAYFRYVVLQEGEGAIPLAGAKMKVQYKGRLLRGGDFVSTADAGKPWFGENPQPFEFEVGKTSINPGFDTAVARMKKGERRVLIIPASQAYGESGYYPPERKGERRFHVSPNQILVYEVEVLEVLN